MKTVTIPYEDYQLEQVKHDLMFTVFMAMWERLRYVEMHIKNKDILEIITHEDIGILCQRAEDVANGFET